MPHLDPTAGPHHPPERIAAWMRTLAALHAEHERSPRKRARIEAHQAQAERWLRAWAERRRPEGRTEETEPTRKPARIPARTPAPVRR